MDLDHIQELAAANARSARQLLGVAVLAKPLAEDPGFALREKVLLRALYPQAAPPPVVSGRPDAGSALSETGASAVTSAATPNGALTVTKSGQAPPPASHPKLSSALVSDSLLSGTKRRRDGAGGQHEEDTPILSVDPTHLKSQHALVVASTAHDAAAAAMSSTGSGGAYTAPSPWKMSKVLVGHHGWVWTAAVDPTNSWFATGGFDAVIKVWDLSSGSLKMDLTGHKEAVRSIALSATTPYMFSGSDDHSIKCWDLERNEVVREFFGHRSSVHCVGVHPTLDLVFSGGRDKTVRVWDVRTRACVHTMDGHTDSVMSLIAQPNEPQLLSGGSDGMIYLWDIAKGRSVTRLTRHTKPVRGLAITPSGDELVSCGADEIRFWKLPAGDFACNASTIVDKPLKKRNPGAPVDAEEELAYRWSCCAISPRGVLGVGSQDGHLGFFDTKRPQSRTATTKFYCPYQMTKTKSIPGTLVGEGGINCLVYDASGTRMITAESDKSVKIWKLRDE